MSGESGGWDAGSQFEPADLEELLVGYALDALDDDDRARVDAVLAVGGSDVEQRLDQLRATLAELAIDDEEPPPPELRDRILVGAGPTDRSARPMSTPAAAFGRSVDGLAAVLQELDPADWTRRADPYEWSIHELVAHLVVIERYSAACLGSGSELEQLVAEVGGDPDDHLDFGRDLVAELATGDPGHTAGRWLTEARTTAAAFEAEADGDRALSVHDWPLTVNAFAVARTFEVWTHTDDVRRSIGRRTETPSPADLAVMADTSVGLLPSALTAARQSIPDVSVRVVLTGAGGGTWVVPLGSGGEEAVTIVADVVDYCRMASRRLPVAELDTDIEGDGSLAAELLRAASLLAV